MGTKWCDNRDIVLKINKAALDSIRDECNKMEYNQCPISTNHFYVSKHQIGNVLAILDMVEREQEHYEE